MKLAGKKAPITGGNSGIGLATAHLFIAEGADVTVSEDRRFAELAKDFGKLDIVFAIFEKVVHTGSIIFNGSVYTYLGQPGVAAYAATKGVLVSMARANASAEESARVSGFISSTVAKAVLFLASDHSSYINAVELMVDGGLTGAPFGAPILRS